jgi:hypothetical protein
MSEATSKANRSRSSCGLDPARSSGIPVEIPSAAAAATSSTWGAAADRFVAAIAAAAMPATTTRPTNSRIEQ